MLAPSTPGAWRATIVWFSHVSFCAVTRTCEGSGDLGTDIVGSCPGLPAAGGVFRVTWLSEDRWFFVQETRGADGSTDRMDGVVQPAPG